MKYLFIISLTASLSSGATFFYLTKKMDPDFFKQLTNIAGIYLNKIKDPNGFCPTGQTAGGQSPTSENRGVASGSDFSDLVKQAREAQKEREKFLKELDESKPY